MEHTLTQLKALHKQMNGEIIPLEAYFQLCPDYMLMVGGSTYNIKRFNGTVARELGWKNGEMGEVNIFDILSPLASSIELPKREQDHLRFMAHITKSTGETVLLDFNSTYIADGNYLILTGRLPLQE